MRRWFQTPQWLCSVCEDRIRLTELLAKGTFTPEGKVECPKCALGGKRLKRMMGYLKYGGSITA